MKRMWSTDELAARWALSADDLRLTVDHGGQAKLGLMCQLAFWREHARFPEIEADIAPARLPVKSRNSTIADSPDGHLITAARLRQTRRRSLRRAARRQFPPPLGTLTEGFHLNGGVPPESP